MRQQLLQLALTLSREALKYILNVPISIRIMTIELG
jgi:hypothetical protein